ncbi:hypothetical protein HPB47_027466 [Ixodes persulcatus]|uniref:Uncharacterized protein n=1 Tax=Ixodes persulcatus TaxID=34615 RepID=A0AC60PX84_IXOPE|nr:hypothetical protein HPB47_027466 [Ixodes persulcatus]
MRAARRLYGVSCFCSPLARLLVQPPLAAESRRLSSRRLQFAYARKMLVLPSSLPSPTTCDGGEHAELLGGACRMCVIAEAAGSLHTRRRPGAAERVADFRPRQDGRCRRTSTRRPAEPGFLMRAWSRTSPDAGSEGRLRLQWPAFPSPPVTCTHVRSGRGRLCARHRVRSNGDERQLDLDADAQPRISSGIDQQLQANAFTIAALMTDNLPKLHKDLQLSSPEFKALHFKDPCHLLNNALEDGIKTSLLKVVQEFVVHFPALLKSSRELRRKFGLVCVAMDKTIKSLKTVCPSSGDVSPLLPEKSNVRSRVVPQPQVRGTNGRAVGSGRSNSDKHASGDKENVDNDVEEVNLRMGRYMQQWSVVDAVCPPRAWVPQFQCGLGHGGLGSS